MSVTVRLFSPLLASPARPLITHYDDEFGTRIELSRITTANWAAKTANWLRDELDIEPGCAISVKLPAHWQTLGVLLGSWWCGAHVTSSDEILPEVAFEPPFGVVPNAVHVARVSLDPMGRGFGSPPGNRTVDYINESRIFGDDFVPYAPVPGNFLAFEESTVDDLVELATQRAKELNIGPTDRVLSTLEWSNQEGLVDGLLAVLAAGASLVQCSNLDPAQLEKRRATERTTVELGVMS